MPEKCTNASLPPSSGVMKPKPFSSENHLTTPVATILAPPQTYVAMREEVLPARPVPHCTGATSAPTRKFYQPGVRRLTGGAGTALGCLGLGPLLRRGLVEVGVKAAAAVRVVRGAAVRVLTAAVAVLR